MVGARIQEKKIFKQKQKGKKTDSWKTCNIKMNLWWFEREYAHTGSHVCILGPQLIELFSKNWEVRPCWCVTREQLQGFKSPHHFQLALSAL